MRIPRDQDEITVDCGGKAVHLTNLRKPFWPDLDITKCDLLAYYADVAQWLLPHLRGRAMVMKRYPNGAYGEFFFMKRAPNPRPAWIETCAIRHASGDVIRFPVVDDLATLLWIVNLGCIDLNPWYARCDDVDSPDYLHFDLDPTPGATFEHVRAAALVLRGALEANELPCWAKTSGSKGIHVYVPIARKPSQKEVWTVAKRIAFELAAKHPRLLTAEYRVASRPRRHVLVDYNQNAWGRTLASVYSVRPRARAPVSAPVTWEEIERGITVEDYRIDNMRARLREMGDLFAPMVPRAKPRVTFSRIAAFTAQ